MSIREFKGNVAHSNYDAFMMDRNIAANNTFGVTGNMHLARENPADPRSKLVEAVFEDLTAYKNRNGGFWGRGEYRTYRNIKSADNAIGYTQASGLGGGASLEDPYTSRVLDSLFVGETENIGNPRTDAEKAYGRSLPKPMMPDFPIRGFEYYDARHDVVNTTFVNFQDNATRKTGALSYLLFTSFGVSSNNAIEHVKFENAKPVYFPPMQGNASGPATMETVRPTRPRQSATRTVRSGLAPMSTFSSTTASTTASQPMHKPVRSSPTGTLRCARAMSGA